MAESLAGVALRWTSFPVMLNYYFKIEKFGEFEDIL
jgi:hypothetical protein